jgi:hypothetical protein
LRIDAAHLISLREDGLKIWGDYAGGVWEKTTTADQLKVNGRLPKSLRPFT